MILFTKFGLSLREFELLLRELLLFRNECLLILVHFATLVKESGSRRDRVQFLGGHETFLVIHNLKIYIYNYRENECFAVKK